MDDIDHVDVVFENCDVCKIPVMENSKLLNFSCVGITRNAASVNASKEFHSYLVAAEMYLNFSQEALDLKSNWQILDGLGNTLRDQLKFRDIAAIYVHYADTEVGYYVVYDEENENDIGSPNINQVNEYMPDGSCRVAILRRGKESGSV